MTISAAGLHAALGLPEPTPEQAEVIESPLVPGLVVAGAGSGKTETMAGRVLYLVANQLVRPEQILGLTFTRKAAAGLAARIRRRLRMLGRTGLIPTDAAWSGEPEVWTYHAFGGRVIAEYGPLHGVDPASRVLTPTASWQLARRVVGRWDGDLSTDLNPDQVTEHLLATAGGLADHLTDTNALTGAIAEVLTAIEMAPPTTRQRGPRRSDLEAHHKRLSNRVSILPLVDAFSRAKREMGAIDFADQMQLAAALAQALPQVATALRDRYRVVLLDEYQDTGHAQRIILRALFGSPDGRHQGGHPVMAVGDPVQSIYSWRGASAANLPRFVTDFPQADGGPALALSLSTSFRNPARVLQVANVVSGPMRQAPVQVKALQPRTGAPDGEVLLAHFDTVDEEDSWVAGRIAEHWREAGAAGDPPPTTAVLLRRRRDMDAMAAALRAEGLPVEVVGIGGLLAEPEVADLLAVLRMLVDSTAGDAAIRILTGARWRIGTADLEALARRAAVLAAQRPGRAAGQSAGSARAAVREALSQADFGEDIDGASLIDAIAEPGPEGNYSAEGFRRIGRLAGELHRLRSRLSQPLPDLVADIERTTGLDVEVAVHSTTGRVHLDAFADVVAEVAAAGAGPLELVEYLQTAREREDGLTPGEAEPNAVAGRVQVLTVHAAKGLEWEIVAVPHLCDTVFPSGQGRTWLTDSTQLPPSVRGDGGELAELRLPMAGDQSQVSAALDEHVAELKAAAKIEERRLLYVALTRSERTLLVSGHQWGRTAQKPYRPSEFLTEIKALADEGAGVTTIGWAEPADPSAQNPLLVQARSAPWPADPLGARRAAMESAAERVRAAEPGPETVGPDATGDFVEEPDADDPFGWDRDARALLAERARSRAATIEVTLPAGLAVTELVDLAQDPAELARRLRRPVPHAPTPQARRGTAFHAWLERYFGGEPLLDISELPGASDRGAADDAEFDRLREAFLASEWAGRVPRTVELPFATTIAGVAVRGRIDAVFADDDGGFTVVDWKTGRPPPPDRLDAATVQLAVYRIAAAELLGVPVERVRAAFVHVLVDRTVAPVNIWSADQLAALVRSLTDPEQPAVSPRQDDRAGGADMARSKP